ncbi:EF-hand domain-containing protein [Synechococcus sp. CS-1328]|uniref:EF-hand domain-containing protein n=1 Tax=Synechococcus sp. CS-1328 TaxID=2847976 RepID=UPI00223A71C0|nr:EF-hand domain-containing protein [Synechococcus sp. CS-1328]MCT0226364.1 EF-hand domain-containing protein [Synechococcus sp. CS-1328]
MSSGSERPELPAPQAPAGNLPAQLIRRYLRLFAFYDRDGDGRHTLRGDFDPVAAQLAKRWQGRCTPSPNLLQLLLDTYRHENSRRDSDQDGQVSQEEFVASHARVLAAFQADPDGARRFIVRSAGGFFDVLDLDGDGMLCLDDLAAFAAAYGHPSDGIAANLDAMLAALGLPAGLLPREAFLTLVEQYWFDPSPEAPGSHLFDGVGLSEPSPNQHLHQHQHGDDPD